LGWDRDEGVHVALLENNVVGYSVKELMSRVLVVSTRKGFKQVTLGTWGNRDLSIGSSDPQSPLHRHHHLEVFEFFNDFYLDSNGNVPNGPAWRNINPISVFLPEIIAEDVGDEPQDVIDEIILQQADVREYLEVQNQKNPLLIHSLWTEDLIRQQSFRPWEYTR
jgi:hypothetical protein